jgi:hypothetical protein
MWFVYVLLLFFYLPINMELSFILVIMTQRESYMYHVIAIKLQLLMFTYTIFTKEKLLSLYLIYVVSFGHPIQKPSFI